MMKNLIDYKSDLLDLQRILRNTRSFNARREYVRAIRFFRSRIRFLERLAGIGLICLILFVTGCHTINGAGKDLQAMSAPYIQNQGR